MKRIKLFTIVICTLIWSSNITAQSLKTHKGELRGGNETYTFYIEKDEEVRHGAYNYIKRDRNSDGATSEKTIKGEYVKGYKNGTWLYTFKQVDVENGSNNYVTGTTSMTMTYKNGMPNGVWKYSSTGKRRSRRYSFGGWSWGPYVTTSPTHISTTFSNGIMVGGVSYSTPWEESKGILDNEGWLIGQWRVNKQGLMVNFINGVDLFDPKDKDLTELQRRIAALPEEEREEFCLENDLTIELKSGKNFFNLNDGYFDNGMWLHREITGDKTYKSEDGLNYKDSREYGKYLIIDRKKFRSLASINSSWARESSTGMRKLLNNNKNELSKDDQQILNDAIKGREIMEIFISEYNKPMEYYRNLKNFKTPNSIYMSSNLLSIYKEIETNAKKNLNASINADTLNIIDMAFVERSKYSVSLRAYSPTIDYGVYLDKVKKITPVLNTIPDSLSAITSLHAELVSSSKVIRNEFNSIKLNTLLRSVLNEYINSAVPKIKNTTTLSDALFYAKTMSQATTAMSKLDKQLVIIEKGLTKSISLGSNPSTLLSSSLSSSKNKLIKMYYTIAEQVLEQLVTQFDYDTLSTLCEVAYKVESLKNTNTKKLEKELKKEPDVHRKMQIILAQ